MVAEQKVEKRCASPLTWFNLETMAAEDPWDESHTYVTNDSGYQQVSMLQQVTTKVPPSFDGRQSWFAYEEAVDDWCDIAELDPEKRGPALRNRLTDDALVYKPLLDRDLLRDPATGVKYFKDQMMSHDRADH